MPLRLKVGIIFKKYMYTIWLIIKSIKYIQQNCKNISCEEKNLNEK